MKQFWMQFTKTSTIVITGGIFFFLTGILFFQEAQAERVVQEAQAERVVSLDGEWRFQKDPTCKQQAEGFAFQDNEWERVTVPHDWAISGPFNPNQDGSTGRLPWRGVGWYRKAIEIPATQKGNSVYLDFDGVMASPEIYVNGIRIGGWDYGYMSFRVDATRAIRFGEKNVIAVRADTRDHGSRWYPGAGIYRSVRLVSVPPVQLEHHGIFISTPTINDEAATVRVETAVTNALSSAATAQVSITLQSPSGQEVAHFAATESNIQGNGRLVLSHEFSVKNPERWDVDSPALYSARVTVNSKKAEDTETVRFGIRTIAFPPDDGFHLNGRRVQIYGVDLHADMGPLGMAFNRSVMRRQLEIMKDMGANALRTSHNAPDPQVLELCDEMGIVVWNECFDKWDRTSGRKSTQNLEEYVTRNLKQFTKRDRNHPSVIIWSIGNEIPPADEKNPTGMTMARCRDFRDAIRTLDTTRPVGIGNCHGNAVDMGIFDPLDITGWNYGQQYVKMKNKYPNKPVLYSESASALSSYGFYDNPPAPAKTTYATDFMEVSSYDHNAAPWSDIPDLEFDRMEKHTYCGGEFVWTGIDYLGEPTPYMHYFKEMQKFPVSEMARSSYFGIVDLMGIPKDRFYLYRSHWNRKEETLHILPHWNWEGKEGKNVPVYVYTSGDSAELFLNGKSLGKRTKGVQQKMENFAAGKQASASSSQNTSTEKHPAADATDGKTETRWCAESEKSGAWWQVDLGKSITFGTILPTFEQAPASYAYEILLSDDGEAWTKFAEKALWDGQSILSKTGKARFIRILFTKTKKNTWPSIVDFTVSAPCEVFRINPYYKLVDNYRLRWLDVPYQPGELKVIAYKKGEKIAEKTMVTAGKAEKILLTAEKPTLPADGKTVVFVQVDVTDARGIRNPLSRRRINFHLTGPGKILAVGNANPRGNDAFTKTSSHPLFFGKAIVAIQRDKDENGQIILSADAPGLEPATVRFK